MVGGFRGAATVPYFAWLQLAEFTIEVAFRVEVRFWRTAWVSDPLPLGLMIRGEFDAGPYCNYYLRVNDASVLFDDSTIGDVAVAGGWVSTAPEEKELAYAVGKIGVGGWHRLALTYDGTTGRLYYAAGTAAYALVDTLVADGPDTTSTADLLLPGAMGLTGLASSNGGVSLSEARVWDSARDLTALNATRAQRLVGNESGLVWYGACDDDRDATAGVLTDRTLGGGNDATLSGATEWTDGPPDLLYPTGLYRGPVLGWVTERAAAISATDSAAAYPVANLRSPRQDIVWRSADDSALKRVVCDLREPFPVSAVYIGGHNLTSAATVTIALHTADSWGAPAVSEPVAYHPRRIYHVLARPYQYRYLAVEFTDAANPDGYIEVGTIQPFAVHEFGEFGAEAYTGRDPSTVQITPSGDLVSRVVGSSIDQAFGVSGLRASEARRVREILREAASGRPVWLCPDPTRGLYHYSTFGTLTGEVGIAPDEPSHTRRSLSGLAVREDRA